jgi:hypothetical protein
LEEALEAEVFYFGDDLGLGEDFVAVHEVGEEGFLPSQGREENLITLKGPQVSMEIVT